LARRKRMVDHVAMATRPAGLPPGAHKTRQQGSEFWVAGDSRKILRDAYHIFLRLRWSVSFLLIGVAFFLANLVFGLAYYLVGGVAGSTGSFFDAVSFSVETMATVGYGVMHPEGVGARIIMIIESIVGIIVSALATGLVFAKFSRPTTRIAFSANAVITTHDGTRSLIFRVGNRRSNVIVEAQLHVSVVTTTKTAEGETFYKAQDLKLTRDRQVGMTRGWTVFHTIDGSSPLFGIATEEGLKKAEVEIYISLTGIDDVTTQAIHTIHRYEDRHIKIDHHFADTLTELEDGTYLVDLSKFDVLVPDGSPRASVRA
jgi:inward rectifier potassium channel